MSDESELAWASGLLVGEGCVGTCVCRNSSGSFQYLSIQIGMYDERAISRFAAVFDVPYRKQLLVSRQRDFYKVQIRGRPAERAIARMWKYIHNTDKGDQALVAARKLGVEDWITGAATGVRPQLNRTQRGRKTHASQCLQ